MKTSDPYLDPVSGVLKNNFSISDKNLLAMVERTFTTLRVKELAQMPIQGKFDFEHLKAIHKYIFQDVYQWAGQVRSVSITKGIMFCPHNNIDTYQSEIFEKLSKNNYLKGLDSDHFSAKAAELLGDVNALHPFREGNGRTQREFLRELAHEAGYNLDFSKVSQEQMITASIDSMRCDYNGLQSIIRDGLVPFNVLEKERRINEIKGFTPDSRFRHSLQHEYLKCAKQIYDKDSSWPGSSADEKIVASLFKSGFEKQSIINVLIKKSPEMVKKLPMARVVARQMVLDVSKIPEIRKAIREISRGLGR